jgi:hypothetical protein
MSPDEKLLQQHLGGKDADEPRRLEFVLRFPTEDGAADAASRLEELAFKPSVEHDSENEEWVLLALKTMYPRESDLAMLRSRLDAIAKEGGGKYEGWHPAR